MDQAYTRTTDEVTAYFGVDENVGLTDDQVQKNSEKYGANGEFCMAFGVNYLDVDSIFLWPVWQVIFRDGRHRFVGFGVT